jgi:hypothetical protein
MLHRQNILILTWMMAFLFTSAFTAQAQSKAVRARFPRGRSSTVLKGRILGRDTKDYLIGAKAGQTMTLRLSSSNQYAYFVVYSINGRATDMNETTEWSERLSETGDYMIRVFMMRAGARRKGAAASYTLNVSIQ